jgi:O-methyltransferase
MIYQFSKQISSLKGDIAEVGVFKGGTARLLAESTRGQNKRIHLFDTFEGIPHSDPKHDIVRQGDFKDTSLEGVKRYLSGFDHIDFYQGLFPQTARSLEALKFSLAHIDVDIHRSVADCCHFFYPRMEKGGIMIFDDYGHPCCPGAKTAVDEFFIDKAEKPCYLPTGQCVVIRL